MAKHAANDRDDEATSPKRPRINGTGPSSQTLPASTPPPLPKARATQDGSDDDEEEEDDMDVEEDEEEQARQTQQVKDMRSKTKATGQVAQAGIIEQVHLENFMSHKLTTVNFGPQINFLVGMNGSGKSAILTGVTMALGGNAKLTNRASKSSGFVREGCNLAKASVKLRNRGRDAYHHNVYGDSITIERTLRVNGGGQYKMISAEGVTICNKKHTLDLILDHFNIQVDNPMTVLSQDQSRQFLASASAKDKYQFFLRGTQLQQLTEEYEQIRSNTEAMEEALERKKEVLPELKDAYRRARDRAKDAEAAVGQQEKVDKMKEELAWSYVDDVEDSIKRGQLLVEKEERLGPKIEAELEKFEATQAAAEEEIGQCEEATAEAQAKIEELTPEAEELNEVVKKEKAKASAWRDQERKTNAAISRMRATLEEQDQQMADEKKKLDRDIKAEQQPIFDKIALLNDGVSKIGSNQMKAGHDLEDLLQRNGETIDRLHAVKDKIGGAQQEGAKIREQVATLNRAKGNSLFAFGPRMPEFMRAIDQERSWRDNPVGPAGNHMKLKEPRYAAVLEAFFAQSLNAFIVTNEQDRALLSSIHRQFNMGYDVPIILARRDDSFFQDVVNGEPAPEILTMRRALVFNNPLVEQAMIVSRAIERSALVPLRPDGDDLLRTHPRNVLEAYSSDLFKLGYFNNKSTTNVVPHWKGAQRFNPDVTGQIRNLQEQYRAVEQDIANFEQEKGEIDAQLAAIHNQKTAIDRNIKQGAQRINTLNRQLEQENGKLHEDEPTNIAAIEEMRKETNAELESLLAQYQAGVEDRNREKLNLEPTVIRKGVVEKELRDNTKLANKLSGMLEESVARRVNAQSAIEQYIKKLDTHKAKVAEMQRQVDDLTPELKLRTEQASTICARPEVEKKRSTAKLTQEIQNMEKALKDREKRQGATTEQIMTELAVRKRTVAEALSATNDLANLIRALEAAYQSRITRWADFRDQIAARAKLQFLFHLSNRGFTGKLTFDHNKNALHIRVQTEDAGGAGKKKRTQLKDSKALSGGEKSFSTICLLLTMWEAVGCPLRCLDEFDVFMDAVNRRISMKMMVDTAKAANGVQFILITPQDMGSATYGPEVRISKLQDPDRNQGVLAIGR